MTFMENQDKLQDFDGCSGQWVRLLYHLAPLCFAGKPAILINQPKNAFEEGLSILGEDWFTMLVRDCVSRVLRWDRAYNRLLVLHYRPGPLQETLGRPENRKFLRCFGYGPESNLELDFNHLQSRLKGSFPHEIGFFLGIPAHDVAGFIEKQGKNYLLNGYWKVYHEPNKARRVFGEYDQAKRRMNRLILEQLKRKSPMHPNRVPIAKPIHEPDISGQTIMRRVDHGACFIK